MMSHNFMDVCTKMGCDSDTIDTSKSSLFTHELVRCAASLHGVVLRGSDYGITKGGADHILELLSPP